MKRVYQILRAGVPFEIGGIPVCKCESCLVTRELSEFYHPGCRTAKPAAARPFICTTCR